MSQVAVTPRDSEEEETQHEEVIVRDLEGQEGLEHHHEVIAAREQAEEEQDRDVSSTTDAVDGQQQQQQLNFTCEENELLCSIPVWITQSSWFANSAEAEEGLEGEALLGGGGKSRNSVTCKRTAHDVPLIPPRERGPLIALTALASGSSSEEEGEDNRQDIALLSTLARLLCVVPMAGFTLGSTMDTPAVIFRSKHTKLDDWRAISHFAFAPQNATPPAIPQSEGYFSVIHMLGLGLTGNIALMLSDDPLTALSDCGEKILSMDDPHRFPSATSNAAELDTKTEERSADEDEGDEDDDEAKKDMLFNSNDWWQESPVPHSRYWATIRFIDAFCHASVISNSPWQILLLLRFLPPVVGPAEEPVDWKGFFWKKAAHTYLLTGPAVRQPQTDLTRLRDEYTKIHPDRLESYDVDVWEQLEEDSSSDMVVRDDLGAKEFCDAFQLELAEHKKEFAHDDAPQQDSSTSATDDHQQKKKMKFNIQRFVRSQLQNSLAKRWKLTKRVRKNAANTVTSNSISKVHPKILGFLFALHNQYLPRLGGTVQLPVDFRSRVLADLSALMTFEATIRLNYSTEISRATSLVGASNTNTTTSSVVGVGSSKGSNGREGYDREEGEGEDGYYATSKDLARMVIETCPSDPTAWSTMMMALKEGETARIDDGTGKREYTKLEMAARATKLDLEQVGEQGDHSMELNNLAASLAQEPAGTTTEFNGKQYTAVELAILCLKTCYSIGILRCSAGAEYALDTLAEALPVGETVKGCELNFQFSPREVDFGKEDEDDHEDDDDDSADTQGQDARASSSREAEERPAEDKVEEEPPLPPRLVNSLSPLEIFEKEFSALDLLTEALKYEACHPVLWYHVGARLQREKMENPLYSTTCPYPQQLCISVPTSRIIQAGDEILSLALSHQTRIITTCCGNKKEEENDDPIPSACIVASTPFGSRKLYKEMDAIAQSFLGAETYQSIPNQELFFDEMLCYAIAISIDEEALLQEVVLQEGPHSGHAGKRLLEVLGKASFSEHALRHLEAL